MVSASSAEEQTAVAPLQAPPVAPTAGEEAAASATPRPATRPQYSPDERWRWAGSEPGPVVAQASPSELRHDVRLRRWLYLIAALRAAVAALVTFFTLGAVTAIFPSNATRVTAPGSATITLAEPGTYTISYERQARGDFTSGAHASSHQPNFPAALTGLQISIRSADSGDRVPVHVLDNTFTYQSGSTVGFGLGEFSINRPGKYVLVSRLSNDGVGGPVTLAVAKSAPGDVPAYVLGAFIAIALLLAAPALGAVALLLLGLHDVPRSGGRPPR